MQPNETLKPRVDATPSFADAKAGENAWVDRVKKDVERHKGSDIGKEEAPEAKKLWTWMGDVVRDIDTANKMAKAKFDGDSALMHIARGTVTTGLGAGLEKSMDFVWDQVWRGEIPFFDKARFGAGMAESMNKFALEPGKDLNARLTYLLKEGSQDLSLALFYNFIAFRGQPLLPKAEAKHLMGSVLTDAAEAFLSPNLPDDIRRKAQQSKNAIIDADVSKMRQEIGNLRNSGRWQESVHDDPNIPTSQASIRSEFPDIFNRADADTLAADLEKMMEAVKRKQPKGSHVEYHQDNQELIDALRTQMVLREGEKVPDARLHKYKPSSAEAFIRSTLNLSNPVTILGVDWVVDGVLTWVKNVREVRKTRGERGGLAGKSVFMPHTEKKGYRNDSYHKDSYRKDDRRGYGERRYDNAGKKEYTKKVYYGRGKSDRPLTQEEYDLKMDS